MINRLLMVLALASSISFAQPLSGETRDTAERVIAGAIDFLRAQQDDATGGWAVNPGGPNFPAVSSLALTGMLLDPAIDHTDPDVARGIAYVLGFAKLDGGIHDNILPTYNTAISVSMLSHVPTPEAAQAIQSSIGLLKRAQWGAFDAQNPEAPGFNEPVDEDHPFYGGVGYGNNGRPDMSNMQFFLQALHDAGVSTDDPAYERALTFLRRTQMDERVNDRDYAEGSRQGGFVYATVPNTESIDDFEGQSQAGEVIETLSDGTRASRLRAYGSITYAGFKSLIFADLDPDDVRVQAALGWITSNYTLDENPGLGGDGFYYYLLSFARALDAWGDTELDLASGESIDWRADLVSTLADLQRPDGSFEIRSERWMEGDPVLTTAYALIALQHAMN
ncbi:MAG: hypothetical protein AAGI17_10240 [Planctomycetota bacterium]